MEKTVWILETDANYYVSDSLERLYDKALDIVENWASELMDEIMSEREMEKLKNELKETYEDEFVDGFHSDFGEIYCYKVEWV